MLRLFTPQGVTRTNFNDQLFIAPILQLTINLCYYNRIKINAMTPKENVKPKRTRKVKEEYLCYIHESVEEKEVDNIRQKVCVAEDEFTLTEFEGHHYCLFHLPTKEKDGEKLEQIIYKRFEEAAAWGAWFKTKFPETKMVGHNDFRYVWFPQHISFKHKIFGVSADFSGANFGGSADFSGANFSGWFKSSANFSHAKFSGSVDFSHAKLSGTVNFSSATFDGKTSFCLASFENRVHFWSATFNGEASFDRTTFKGGGNFDSTNFRNYTDFSSATFSEYADFCSATFSLLVDFRSATFGGSTDFDSAAFSNFVFFDSAIFHGETKFDKTKFGKIGQTSFIKAKFEADVLFENTEFNNPVSFDAAVFGKESDIIFLKSFFAELASFKYTAAEGYLRFSKLRQGKQNKFDFEDATFDKATRVSFHTLRLCPNWFVNVDSRNFVFTDITWDNLSSDYRNKNIERELQSLQARAIDEQKKRLLEISARQLAVNAEENNRYEEAAKFPYMAMETRRLEETRQLSFSRFLIWLYKWTSGYGENWTLAALVLIGVLVFYGYLYASPLSAFDYGKDGKPPSADTVAQNLCDKVRIIGDPQMNVCEGILHSLSVATFQRPEPKANDVLTKLFVVLEVIFAPLQAALLALAIRRKFMR
jgi:Pentapeptide repeats (9 copies)